MTENMYGRNGLWYVEPAGKWVEALPVGNGKLGGMIFGGKESEHIQLNEETVWDGGPLDRDNLKALDVLYEMRKLLFDGRNAEAEKVANDFMGIPMEIDSYQPLGDLHIEFDHSRDCTNYSRALDLDTAIAHVDYLSGGAGYSREVFSSAPGGVIAMKISCGVPGRLGMLVSLSREKDACVSMPSDDILVLSGRCSGKGVAFEARVYVVAEGGLVEKFEGKIRVVAADSVIVFIAGATDFYGKNPHEVCNQRIQDASQKGFVRLKEEHVSEYRTYYRRVQINLSAETNKDRLPVNKRIEAVKAGGQDSGLIEIWFNYLRYLIISSSRPGCMPSNLQGIWNDKMKAPWNSDYHPNVNMQINYWAVEAFNLSECHTPLFHWLEEITQTGSRTARIHYGARGWVLHHVSDIFGRTTPVDGPWGIWPVGGAWLCRHVYEHYLFNGDKKFLKDKAYPILKGAVQFMLDFLVEAPENTPVAGCLVTCPSHSPESRFKMQNGGISWLTYAATMDNEIIWDLFNIYLKTVEQLSDGDTVIDSELKDAVEKARKRMPPLMISHKTGGIQEWVEDYDEYEPGHRHISHLYGLYPGNQINSHTPELLEAARNTLERRLSNHYDGQGWSLSWIANIFARLHEGDRAYSNLNEILAKHSYDNLFVNAHGFPQVGDAQGVGAAVVEMLLQSQEGEISLLPALPHVWKDGFVRGLKARGGYEVEIHWQNSSLSQAIICSSRDGLCRVRASSVSSIISDGSNIAFERCTDGTVTFNTAKGRRYCLE